MKAPVGGPHVRAAQLLVLVASFICGLELTSIGFANAKTRPPVEMGDPDGTGDQGSADKARTGSSATSKAAAPSATVLPKIFSVGGLSKANNWNFYVYLFTRLIARP
jgi:hypothetical protein